MCSSVYRLPEAVTAALAQQKAGKAVQACSAFLLLCTSPSSALLLRSVWVPVNMLPCQRHITTYCVQSHQDVQA